MSSLITIGFSWDGWWGSGDRAGRALRVDPSIFLLQLSNRWTHFLSVTVPFATRVVRDYTGGRLLQNERELARDFRVVIEKLGPTFIKVLLLV